MSASEAAFLFREARLSRCYGHGAKSVSSLLFNNTYVRAVFVDASKVSRRVVFPARHASRTNGDVLCTVAECAVEIRAGRDRAYNQSEKLAIVNFLDYDTRTPSHPLRSHVSKLHSFLT